MKRNRNIIHILSVVLVLISLSLCLKEEKSGFATGTKNTDFTVVNSSNEVISINVPPSSAFDQIEPEEYSSGGSVNVSYIKIDIYAIRNSEWIKVANHKFTESGTWNY